MHFGRFAGLETCDTADSEVCATYYRRFTESLDASALVSAVLPPIIIRALVVFMNRSALVLGGFACFVIAGQAAAPPGLGFRESVTNLTLSGVSQMTDLEWAPDASERLFIAQKGGVVRVFQRGNLLPTPFVTETPVHTASECGLIGMCFDPNFLQNGYVYFFVTSTPSEQKIVRYTDSGGIGLNRLELIRNLPTVGANHDGGGVAVGPDGRLYGPLGTWAMELV
jgi:Glucose / Sorbosone dehydrogenase